MRNILRTFLALLLLCGQAMATATLPPISAPLIINTLAAQITPTNNNIAVVGDSITALTVSVSGAGVTASGGVAPYTFTTSGAPSGMSFQTATPSYYMENATAALGTYTISVTATDSSGTPLTGTQSYTVTVATTGITIALNGAGTGTLALSGPSNFRINDLLGGYSAMVPFLTNRRVVSPQSLNFGHPGDATTDVLNRMGPILAAAPNIGAYICMIGTNDLQYSTAATIEANILNIWTQLLATGRPVIALMILPRNVNPPGALIDKLWAVNRWMLTQANLNPNLYIVDDTAYGNPLSPTAYPYNLTASPVSLSSADYNFSYDGLHPNVVGAYLAYQNLAALINLLFPTPPLWAEGVSDLYSGSNPTGNLLSNAMMNFSAAAVVTGSIAANTLTVSAVTSGALKVGTQITGTNVPANEFVASLGTGSGGTGTYGVTQTATVSSETISAVQGTVGGRVTGIAPDGWSANSVDASCGTCTYTGVAAAATLADGTPAVQFTLGGTAQGGYQTEVYLSQAPGTLSNFGVGDKLQASCRVEMSAGSSHISMPFIQLTYTAGSGSAAQAYILAAGPTGLLTPNVAVASPTVAYSGTLATPTPAPPLPAGLTGSLSLSVGVYIMNNAVQTIAGVYRIGACALRKVTT